MNVLRSQMRISIICVMQTPPLAQMHPLTTFATLSLVAVLLHSTEASAATDEFRVVVQGHVFQPPEIVIPADTRVKLVVENRDSTPEEFDSYALNREKVIAGKSSATIYIGPLPPGRYPFIGEFHEDSAKGAVVAK